MFVTNEIKNKKTDFLKYNNKVSYIILNLTLTRRYKEKVIKF